MSNFNLCLQYWYFCCCWVTIGIGINGEMASIHNREMATNSKGVEVSNPSCHGYESLLTGKTLKLLIKCWQIKKKAPTIILSEMPVGSQTPFNADCLIFWWWHPWSFLTQPPGKNQPPGFGCLLGTLLWQIIRFCGDPNLPEPTMIVRHMEDVRTCALPPQWTGNFGWDQKSAPNYTLVNKPGS